MFIPLTPVFGLRADLPGPFFAGDDRVTIIAPFDRCDLLNVRLKSLVLLVSAVGIEPTTL